MWPGVKSCGPHLSAVGADLRHGRPDAHGGRAVLFVLQRHRERYRSDAESENVTLRQAYHSAQSLAHQDIAQQEAHDLQHSMDSAWVGLK